MEELTGFQRDLLATIDGLGEPDSLALKAELEASYETEVHHGRLYPNLERLDRKGLVQKGAKDDHINCYTLTQQGRRVLNTQRGEEPPQ